MRHKTNSRAVFALVSILVLSSSANCLPTNAASAKAKAPPNEPHIREWFKDPELQKLFVAEMDWKRLKALGEKAYLEQNYAESVDLLKRARFAASFVSSEQRDDSEETNEKEDELDSFFTNHAPFRLVLGKALFKVARYNEATSEFNAILDDTERGPESRPASPAVKSQALDYLAEGDILNGNYSDAENKIAEALKLDKINPHANVLLGRIRLSQSKFDEAEKLFTAALADAQKTSRPDIECSALDGLAQLRVTRGEFLKARELCAKSLQVARKLTPANSVEEAEATLTLAEIERQYNQSKAFELVSGALETYGKRTKASSHPGMIRGLLLLSRSSTISLPRRAEICLSARHMTEELFVPDCPLIAASYKIAADIDVEQGRIKPALQSINKAIELYTSKFGARSLQVARCLETLGDAKWEAESIKWRADYEYKENLSEVGPLYQKSAEIFDEVLGRNNFFSAIANYELARLAINLKDDEKAITLAEQSRKTFQILLGANSIYERSLQNLLGKTYYEQKETEKAQEASTPVVSGMLKRGDFGIPGNIRLINAVTKRLENPDVGGAYEELPIKLMMVNSENDYMIGTKMLLRDTHGGSPGTLDKSMLNSVTSVISKDFKEYGCNSTKSLKYRIELAHYFAYQKQFQQSALAYQSILEIIDDALGDDHPYLLTVLPKYAEVLKELNRSAEAEKLTKRLELLKSKIAPPEKN